MGHCTIWSDGRRYDLDPSEMATITQSIREAHPPGEISVAERWEILETRLEQRGHLTSGPSPSTDSTDSSPSSDSAGDGDDSGEGSGMADSQTTLSEFPPE